MTASKRKICVIVTNRASYARIKTVLRELKNRDDTELQLVVGGSVLLHRFGKAIDVIRADGFVPNAVLYCVLEGETPTTMAKSTGLAIVELSTIFDNLKPDIVLTIADRHETAASAIAASYMNIPLAHTQGGESTGSIDESVRHAVTKLAHIHFPATKKAAENVRRMGESPDTIHMAGCPSMDILEETDLSLNPKHMSRYRAAGTPMDWDQRYLLVLQHPITSEYGSGQQQIEHTIHAIHELHMHTVWLWPNVDAGSDDVAKGIRMYREKHNPNFVHFYRNFPPEAYASLLANAQCIVGNSSSGIREGAYLGVPCVNIGSRQSFRERGNNVLDCDYDSQAILQTIKNQLGHGFYEKDDLYGNGKSGNKIANILATIPRPNTQKRLWY